MIRLAWAYLAARPLLTALHVLLLAIGVATLVLLLLFTAQAERRLERDAKPVDLVVGAKGSPLQLILSAVLHADVPTGNIPWDEARRIAASPLVASATPLALGDSYRGFRIVGTDASYLELYGAHVASGRLFTRPMEAVLGAAAAERTGLAPGQRFAGSHGLAAAGGADHGEDPYEVVGILAPTGTVVDRLVLTSVESVWHVHDGHAPPAGAGAAGDEHREVTALLVRYRTPIAAIALPRQVNGTTVMQAASPAYESARLLNLIGVGTDALAVLAFVLMGSAALSVFIALMSALQERRHDLALLRLMGARPRSLFALVAAEGVTLVVAGAILGLALGHVAAEALGQWLARTQPWSITGFAWEPREAGLVVLVIGAGLVTCLVPAIQAYARDPARVLLER